jgi:hypothetical protein
LKAFKFTEAYQLLRGIHPAYAMLAAGVAFNLYVLWPEVSIVVPFRNDNIHHQYALWQTAAAILSGRDPTDLWMQLIGGQGYPLSHYYQHLPYVVLAAFYLVGSLLSNGAIAPGDMLRWSGYLLMSLLPLSTYWSMRRFGFDRSASALSGAVGSLISTEGLLGMEFGSYVWSGYGVYTQLWGAHFLVLALGWSYQTLVLDKGRMWAIVLVSLTILSHLAFGYIAIGTIISFAIFATPGLNWKEKAGRLICIIVPVGIITSHFLVPLLVDGAYVSHSVWSNIPDLLDSYGHRWALPALLRGDLFDFGRVPSLTILVGVGLAVCLWRWREARYRLPVILFVVWLMLFFGRPTWGSVLDLLPIGKEMYYHRLINGVHLGGIYAIGVALSFAWGVASGSRARRFLLGPAILAAVLMIPVVEERAGFMQKQMASQQATMGAIEEQKNGLGALINALVSSPPGRVYAGLSTTWGNNYTVGQVRLFDILNQAGLDTIGNPRPPMAITTDLHYDFKDGRLDHYKLFNVRYVVIPVEWNVPAFFQTLGDFGRHRLHSIDTPGYFDLVRSDYAFFGSKNELYPAAAHWLRSDMPRVKQHPVVFLGSPGPEFHWHAPLNQASNVIPLHPLADDTESGQVWGERVEAGAFQTETFVQKPSRLILKVTYDPNWRAYIDGVEGKTEILMPGFIGMPIEPGSHTVRFEYHPPMYRYYLMMVGMMILATWALFEFHPKAYHSAQLMVRQRALQSLDSRWVARLVRRAIMPPGMEGVSSGWDWLLERKREILKGVKEWWKNPPS